MHFKILITMIKRDTVRLGTTRHKLMVTQTHNSTVQRNIP